ncbi:MAG: T9SS type A sorting domain-containing protein, partial [bacterium]|nr:T9SS type A sorting domain-containing protein [bacterium]
VFWQGKRTGWWNLYAKTFSDGNWSDIIRVTNDSCSYLSYSAVIDPLTNNIWIGWLKDRIRFSHLYLKYFDGFFWSDPDTIREEASHLKLLADYSQRLWLFYNNPFGDIVYKRFELDKWSDTDIILEHYDLSPIHEYLFSGPLGALIGSANSPWILCNEGGYHHGGFEWLTIHLTYWQDSIWIDQEIASATRSYIYQPHISWIQTHDLGSDSSGSVYAAYTYEDTSGIYYYLKSFSSETGFYNRQWLLEPADYIGLSKSAPTLGISWSYQHQFYARILSDTTLHRPFHVNYDTAISGNLLSTNVFDSFNNLWVVWEGIKNDKADIFVTFIPYDTLLLSEIKSQKECGNLDFTLFEMQNYPNPFNPNTTIKFQIDQPDRTSLIIYNLLGQQVRKLLDKNLLPGEYRLHWDGKNDAGQILSSGVYFAKLASGGKSELIKLVLVR